MNLSEYRLQRAQGTPLSLPSGLDVTVRDVDLMDLVGTGSIPAPLMGMVDKLQDTKNIKAEDFAAFNELLNVLAAACLASPYIRKSDQDNGEDAMDITELRFKDKLTIFEWANREAVNVEPFREGQGEPVEAVQPG